MGPVLSLSHFALSMEPTEQELWDALSALFLPALGRRTPQRDPGKDMVGKRPGGPKNPQDTLQPSTGPGSLCLLTTDLLFYILLLVAQS